jgi:hypothetical protein
MKQKMEFPRQVILDKVDVHRRLICVITVDLTYSYPEFHSILCWVILGRSLNKGLRLHHFHLLMKISHQEFFQSEDLVTV